MCDVLYVAWCVSVYNVLCRWYMCFCVYNVCVWYVCVYNVICVYNVLCVWYVCGRICVWHACDVLRIVCVCLCIMFYVGAVCASVCIM